MLSVMVHIAVTFLSFLSFPLRPPVLTSVVDVMFVLAAAVAAARLTAAEAATAAAGAWLEAAVTWVGVWLAASAVAAR